MWRALGFLLLIVISNLLFALRTTTTAAIHHHNSTTAPFPGISYYDEDTMGETPFGVLFLLLRRLRGPCHHTAGKRRRQHTFFGMFFFFCFIYSILIIYGQTTCTNNNDGFGSDGNKWERRRGSRRVLELRCVFILFYIYISTNMSLTQHFDSFTTLSTHPTNLSMCPTTTTMM